MEVDEEENADYLKEVEADKVLLKLQFRPFFLLPTTFTEERRLPRKTRKSVFQDADVLLVADVFLIDDK
jgi:hypothetical protein